MKPLSEVEERVANYYDEVVFEAESARLAQDCPVEFAITSRALAKFVPSGAEVTEVGVGVGRYSELLARRGCFLHLADVSARLLEAAHERLRNAGLEAQVRASSLASATNLEVIHSGTMDAALFLGPLYHLLSLRERQQAVCEAARILKPGGLLIAAGINRLSYLRDLFRERPLEGCARRRFHQEYLRDGNLNPTYAPPIGFAHMSSAQEFQELFQADFREVQLMGVESFTNLFQKVLANLPAAETDAWLDLVEATAATPEALGCSDHFLYVGRKRGQLHRRRRPRPAT